MTPLRKVKEEAMTYAATAQSSTVATEYNGWSNRETWVVNLWLTNNERYYDTLQSIIKLNEADEQAAELEFHSLSKCAHILESCLRETQRHPFTKPFTRPEPATSSRLIGVLMKRQFIRLNRV